MDRPRMGRGRHVRGPQIEQHKKSDTREVCEKKGRRLFLFFLRKDRRAFACPPGGSRDKGAAIAALGYRHRRENSVCADCGTGRRIQLVEG